MNAQQTIGWMSWSTQSPATLGAAWSSTACPMGASAFPLWASMYHRAYALAQEAVRRQLWIDQMQPGLN